MSRKKRSGGKRDRGLFKPARHKYLADVITFKDPDSAERSARKLVKETKKTKRRDAAKRRAQALQLAANRARASAKRKNLSRKEREELLEIAGIYDEAAKEAWDTYNSRWGS